MDTRETAPEREADILKASLGALRAVLPPGWSVADEFDPSRAVDARVTLTVPDKTQVRLTIEVKRLFLTRDVPAQLDRLRTQTELHVDAVPTLVARYLSANTRRRIAEEGASYLDATGNARIVSNGPPILIQVDGADRDPWRGPGRPRGTLKGVPAARVVRALLDYAPPYSVPDLVDRSGASTGATYRVVKFLEEEDLLQREDRGPITRVNWPRILERWSDDYGFDRADTTESLLEPRGIETTLERLRGLDPNSYVVTGSVAAQLDAPYAPPRLLSLYVRDPGAMRDQLQLRPVSKGANVRIAANEDDFAFARRRTVNGISYAAPSQVAVDLLTGPGRSSEEAEELVRWMERNEDAWRR